MQRLHIILCSAITLCLISSTGCKKEEAPASPEPEKVSEPETATKSSALTAKDEKEPTDRALQVRKNGKKAKRPTKKPQNAAPEGNRTGKNAGAKKKATAPTNVAKAADTPNSRLAPPRTKKTMDSGEDEYDEPSATDTPSNKGTRAGGPPARQPLAKKKRGGPVTIGEPPRADAEPPRAAIGNDAKDRFRNTRRTPRAVAPAKPAKKDTVRAAGLPTRVRPNAEQLLRQGDLKEIVKLKKPLDVHELSGIEADHEYDGIYWGSPDGSNYYVGLQLWKMRSPIEAQRQYTQMVRSYPNAEETTAVTSKTFLAYWNEFIYLVYLDTTKQSVIAVTCHEKVCTEPSMLVGLAQKSRERL